MSVLSASSVVWGGALDIVGESNQIKRAHSPELNFWHNHNLQHCKFSFKTMLLNRRPEYQNRRRSSLIASFHFPLCTPAVHWQSNYVLQFTALLPFKSAVKEPLDRVHLGSRKIWSFWPCSEWLSSSKTSNCMSVETTEISTSSSFLFIHLFCLFSFPVVSLYCLCLHFGLGFFCLFILLGVTCSKGEGGKEYKKKGRMAGNILAFLYKNITRQKTLHREWEKGRGCQQTLILLLSYWPFRLGYCENKATGNLYSHRTRAWSLLLFFPSRVFLLKFSFVGNNR